MVSNRISASDMAGPPFASFQLAASLERVWQPSSRTARRRPVSRRRRCAGKAAAPRSVAAQLVERRREPRLEFQAGRQLGLASVYHGVIYLGSSWLREVELLAMDMNRRVGSAGLAGFVATATLAWAVPGAAQTNDPLTFDGARLGLTLSGWRQLTLPPGVAPFAKPAC